MSLSSTGAVCLWTSHLHSFTQYILAEYQSGARHYSRGWGESTAQDRQGFYSHRP